LSWDAKENEADAEKGWEVGTYWKRKLVDEFMPTISKNSISVRRFLKANDMI
jgi:hypothetical protein